LAKKFKEAEVRYSGKGADQNFAVLPRPLCLKYPRIFAFQKFAY